MGKDLVDLTFFKDSEEPWGFRLAGGKDFGQPLSISQVATNSLAAKIGLKPNDFLNSIAGKEVFQMTHEEAEKAITVAGNRFNMVIERVNFKKYEKKAADITASKTLEKPHHRKDWNCPWVKKDGSGLKQAVRYVEQPLTSAKTSHQHFYSEPRSILAQDKELSREELEALIREHGQESRPESRLSQGASRPDSRAATQAEERLDQLQQSLVIDQQHQQQQEEMMVTTSREEHQRVSFAGETYSREREEDSQAPPDLEPVLVESGVADMGQYGDEGYEPSADELIDVLKNLENLAAANPELYRAIVEQIKVANDSESGRNSPQYNGSHDLVNGKVSSLLTKTMENIQLTKQ